jgi:hypothetical protein
MEQTPLNDPPCTSKSFVGNIQLAPDVHPSEPAHKYTNSLPSPKKRSWPSLLDLSLSAREQQFRRGGVGGSDANIILSGKHDRIVALWREKRGEDAGPDLSNNLAAALGNWTETFNRHWYERLSGHRVSRVRQSIVSKSDKWRRCTLDGFVRDTGAIWEAKHTSAFATVDEVLHRYMPQLQHNMAVASVERAILSVIFGNHKYEVLEVASDWLYQLGLFEAERQFWQCVLTGEEPKCFSAPEPPKPIGVREVCLEGNNSWAAAAADWLDNREAAKKHSVACSTIKSLVEDDVRRAFGHGIEAKRSKSGAISIRELA